jgi:diacylglycerol kinase (ATP)
MRFEPPVLSLADDRGSTEGPMMLALVANAPRCGAGMQMAPMEVIDDGAFELITLDAVSRGSILLLLAKVFKGTHLGHPKVHHRTLAGALRVASDRPLWAYGDGEPLLEVGERPVEVEMHPGRLRVVSPLRPGQVGAPWSG